MKSTPYISVIIPVRNLSYYLIFENLPALLKQTYTSFEVLIMVNEQSLYDFTLLKKYRWLRIIPTGKITRPAKKRDIGVSHAKGKIIAFIDDDAYPSADWLKNAASIYKIEKKKNKKLVALGGPGILPDKADYKEQIHNQVLVSRLGGANIRYRFIPLSARYVEDFPSMNFFIEKEVFLKAGGFNSDFWPGEDSKLCNTLITKLHKNILYHPKILVYHHRRNDFKGFLKQHGQYGFHRGAFIAHGDRNSLYLVYFFPSLFIIYLLICAFSLIFLPSNYVVVILTPLFFYIFLLLFEISIIINATLNPIIAFGTIFVLVTTHILYGYMFIKGFIISLLKQGNIY